MKKKSKSLLALILALVMLMATLLTGCGDTAADGDSGSTDDANESVTIAVNGNIATLVTYNRSTDVDILVQEQIFDRLVYDNGDGTVSPRLAKEWYMNDDNTVLTFVLNEDAKWHDGEPVTADDVVFTANLIVNPATTTQVRSAFGQMVGCGVTGALEDGATLGVAAVDEHTVTFTFQYPVNMNNILTNFNHEFFVLPEHLLGDKDPATINSDEFWEHPIGSGPFKFVSQIQGESVEYEANADYFLGAPDIEHLTITVTTAANLAAGLISGDYDVNLCCNVPVKDWDLVKEQENLVTDDLASNAIRFMAYNCSREYLTQQVRYALDIAIDRTKIVDSIYRGEAVAINTATTPANVYYNSEFDNIEYDPDKALSILQSEGFDFSRELELVCTPDDEQMAALVQQDLNAIGVTVKVTTQDSSTRYMTAMSGECDMAFASNGGSAQMTSSGSMIAMYRMNLCHIDTPVFDGIIGQEVTTLTEEGLQELFTAYQAAIREVVNASYLVSPNTLIAHSSRISNMSVADFSYTNWHVNQWVVE